MPASTQTKDAEQKNTAPQQDTKEEKDPFANSKYGDLDARWQVVRSAETFYVLPIDPVPAVEEDKDGGIEAQKEQPGKYILRNTRTGEEKELSEEQFAELNFQSAPPNKQV